MFLSIDADDLLMAFISRSMDKKAAVDVFSQWALIGKDEGMEKGHSSSVKAMLELALPNVNDDFSAIDLGCGNGWVTRMLSDLGASHSEGCRWFNRDD